MAKNQEIIAILKTCQITQVDVLITLHSGECFEGKVSGTTPDENLVILDLKQLSKIIELAIQDIKKIEFMGSSFSI